MMSTPPDGGRRSGSSGADAGAADKPQPADLPSTVRFAQPRAAEPSEPLSAEGGARYAETVSIAALNAVRATMDTVDAATAGAPETEHPGPAGGRYEPVRLLGTGGFGEVRLVRDRLLKRDVAMKILRSDREVSPEMRARFLEEIELTAGLSHPGIVAVHDSGALPDGQLWYTMPVVRGRTFRAVIDAAFHDPRASRRRLLDLFARACEAVAYAHGKGVIHRDIKPDNIMIGEHGEVLVMDWGIARRGGAPVSVPRGAPDLPPESAEALAAPVSSPLRTRPGLIFGTPAYMSPEQARGEVHRHGPATDVYALGAVLLHVLTGSPPDVGPRFWEASVSLLEQIASLDRKPDIPPDLAQICRRAMAGDPALRYPDAGALAAEMHAFLEGARRREQALSELARAAEQAGEIAALRASAREVEARARALQSDLRPFDPIEKKRPAWELEDEARRLGRDAALAEAKWMEAVRGALTVDPDLAEAHAMLADHHRERLIEAERSHRDEDAARSEEMLRVHDRGQHAAFLRGDGALTLVTDPPGAEVIVERYVLQDRRLVPVSEGVIGATPLVKVPLKRGSYLLRLRAPGRAEVRYPVLIERDGHWDGCAPGESEPYPILLPRDGELGPDDCYVPAGWAWIGGDAGAVDTLSLQRIWVDAFVMRRFPVTNEEYIEFLNDLVATGREAEAVAACPRAQPSMPQASGEMVFVRDTAGRFGLTAVAGDSSGQLWRPRWPVVLVDWHASMAFARWAEERFAAPWRLSNEIEREKAARGADGRHYPWGHHFDATWACVVDSYAKDPTRADVDHHPVDESPYGVRGLAGNVIDWCENVWTHQGPEAAGGRSRRLPSANDAEGLRAARGGSWANRPDRSRAEARFASAPGARWRSVGLRLARSLGGAFPGMYWK